MLNSLLIWFNLADKVYDNFLPFENSRRLSITLSLSLSFCFSVIKFSISAKKCSAILTILFHDNGLVIIAVDLYFLVELKYLLPELFSPVHQQAPVLVLLPDVFVVEHESLSLGLDGLSPAPDGRRAVHQAFSQTRLFSCGDHQKCRLLKVNQKKQMQQML